MDQQANQDALPRGCRSSIAYALHADDPHALLDHLYECDKVERSVLYTDQGGKVAIVHDYNPTSPWSFLPVRDADKKLCT